MNNKKILALISVFAGFLFLVKPVSAHVVVKPAEVGVAERVNFAVSVPTEEDTPTVMVRLLIPEQIKSVRPNVKPGWNVEMVREGEGEDARVTEIIWSGGEIPADMRDEFVFSSQAPAETTELNWKAYQTYASGNVVSWDKSPEDVESYEAEHADSEVEDPNAPMPYSVTKVIDDLATEESNNESVNQVSNNLLPFGVILALGLSIASIWMQMRKK